ncbi:DNA-binding CsgD family transcriptional regulator [Streptomyces umbrinus]|uniref:DNA-binding CsgD family transcriptional regulator n=1 Tax=Streptomyces umbrinus TaxID=67370 RepID=A0ABU0SS56_9ACTN|nr:LuxR family transcriptional regulator [Streptomyces umbrinus]MDQ1026387.1 DNA-binding CsgD family transcriptional regulator [Streptomyces umbrinus]
MADQQVMVGRERERLLLDGLLIAVAERGAALVLRGEPGMGKTALLNYASVGASARGARVVRLCGVESESVLPFAALADLMTPFRVGLADLPEAQRSALDVCLALAAGPPPNSLAVCAGTLNVLAAAADATPLVVLVDDLQWVDASSRQVLLFVARRLSSERVAMVLAVRSDAPEPTASGLPGVDLAGLPADVCAELLAGRGVAPSPQVLADLVRATGGNPLALLETAAGLSAGQLSGMRPMPELLPMGQQLHRAWTARLDMLPERTRRALALLAAGRSAAPDVLARAFASVGLSPADVDPAHAAGLVTVTGKALDLRHPLLRLVVLEGLTPSARLDVYRVLAGASTGEVRVWYRAAAASGPDEEVAAALDAAADRARERSGFGVAARALRRAAELTSDRRLRVERLLRAAVDAHLGGLPHDAAAWCDAAAAETTDPLLRADIALVRGRVLIWIGQVARAHDQLLDAADAVRTIDPARAGTLLAEAALSAAMSGKGSLALRDAEEAAQLAAAPPSMRAPASPSDGRHPAASAGPSGPAVPDGHGSVEAPSALAGPGEGAELPLEISACASFALALTGQVTAARRWLESARTALESADAVDTQQTLVLIGRVCGWLEDDDTARRVLTSAINAARRSGAPATLAYALGARGELDRWAGLWSAAYADATEALRWAEELRQMGAIGYSLLSLARLDAARGERALCEERIERTRREVGPLGIGSLEVYGSGTLGLVALGHGEHSVAVAYLEHARALAADGGLGNPVIVPFAADLVEAHLRTGDRDRAETVLAWLEERARSTGLAWPAAAAGRGRVLLAGDGDEAEACYAVAEVAHRRREMPFEAARTQLCLGEVLRRCRRPAAARLPLLAAHATFQSLGARPWTARAAVELAAAGERPTPGTSAPAFDRLTPQELQVARTIADGMNNVETAAALFISHKTVEAHLTRVYRKLGVRSRTELTRILMSHGLVPAPPG